MSDLLPCPFCGGDDIWPEAIASPFGLVCGACGAGGPPKSYVDSDEAIDAWNTRATAALAARDARVREAALKEASDRLLQSVNREYGDHRDYRKAILALIAKDTTNG